MKIKTKLTKEYLAKIGKESVSVGGVIHTTKPTIHEVSEENAKAIAERCFTISTFDPTTKTTKLVSKPIVEIIKKKKKPDILMDRVISHEDN